MSLFFSNKNKTERNIILDIQSGLVRGALVEYGKDGKWRILQVATGSIQETLAPTDSQRIIKKIIKLASTITEHLTTISGGKRISEVHYILSSPWITSSLKSIKVDFEKETRISKSIIDGIISSEEKKIPQSMDAVPIERNIFEIKLNGYPVSDYEDKQAHLLNLSLGTSWGSRAFIEKLRSTIEKIVPTRHHTYHSALFMQYIALGTVLDHKKEYVYIHIHSELTDIIIVKDGLCKYIASFPFGTSTLLRKISRTMHQGLSASDSLLSLYQGDKLSESEKKNTKKVIDPLLNAWGSMCIKSLTDSFDAISIPRTVLMSAHSHFELFKEALLFKNDLNLDITPYESVMSHDKISFEKGSARSELMEMYMLALRPMIQ